MDSDNKPNIWDNGYPSGGNYWSDYLTKYPNATEIGSSGIGNMPYVMDANNTDQYPFMLSVITPTSSPTPKPTATPTPTPSPTSPTGSPTSTPSPTSAPTATLV